MASVSKPWKDPAPVFARFGKTLRALFQGLEIRCFRSVFPSALGLPQRHGSRAARFAPYRATDGSTDLPVCVLRPDPPTEFNCGFRGWTRMGMSTFPSSMRAIRVICSFPHPSLSASSMVKSFFVEQDFSIARRKPIPCRIRNSTTRTRAFWPGTCLWIMIIGDQYGMTQGRCILVRAFRLPQGLWMETEHERAEAGSGPVW